VSSDLLLVLRLGVHDDLGREGEEDVSEQVEREVEGREVVSVLENLEHIACREGRNMSATVIQDTSSFVRLAAEVVVPRRSKGR
jgi:hypothetical protein